MKKLALSSNEFRCLSIRQPWAWLACIGAKPIENRVWKTDFRGTIAIHASTSQTMVRSAERNSESQFIKLKDFQFGAIVGLVDLVSIDIYGKQHEEDGHACGPYCWRFENPRLLKQPIPMMGKLNLFKLNAEISESVRNAETFILDWRSDTRIATIVREFQPEPDVGNSYSYTFQEVCDKASSVELEQLLERWTEVAPESTDAWAAWNVFYQDPLDTAKLELGVQRLSAIIEEIFGNQDEAWREVYVDSLSGESASMLDEDKNDVSSEETSDETDSPELLDAGDDESNEEDGDPLDDYWELVSLLKSQFWNYVSLEQKNKAIETAKRLVHLTDDSAEAHFNLGYAHAKLLNEHHLALPSLEKAWQIVQEAVESHNPDEAATTAMQETLEIKPMVLNEIASAYRKLQKLEQAEEMIQLALTEYQDHGYILFQAALIARDRGDKKRALKYAKAVLAIDPGAEQALDIVNSLRE